MDDDLNEKLEALHRQIHLELDAAGELDDEKRRMLEHLQTDIAGALERSESDQEPDLLDRLDDSVAEFEVSHPCLTTAIGQVMDSLSRSGI